ncbi:MAG: aldo/keto reductase [Owenweeksia sp.]|nr:aldo/keto reductase [Owenweeksia sp.]
MEQVQEEGLTRHIGVSNFSVEKLTNLIAESEIKPEMNQVELHPYLQQSELLEYCQSKDINVTAYSPLGSTGSSGCFEKRIMKPVPMDNETIHKNCQASKLLQLRYCWPGA